MPARAVLAPVVLKAMAFSPPTAADLQSAAVARAAAVAMR